ncbi:LOW QUALITY PROTEIN: uncharacterized protein LOC115462289 [Microcaecilia unicolor]|uniref:LOW QUALITY PROTEIN: uncharacterized protein LOC115462289 n=1 Tax=Microcaecilia unicolor TaxID=1415580 RepID=A0A6P7X6T7_9AMPH|nr:LOW QUALITY PROTEIN: uncharacterized protein LOC115462289 [Microcaecilia unicolor]
MNRSPAYLLPQDCLLSADSTLMQPWRCSDSDGYSSLSPASSTDSYSLSPPYPFYPSSPGTYYNLFGAQAQNVGPKQRAKQSFIQQSRRGRSRMACSQRQSASEREKLRMRDLSKALHNLRNYLPPSLVPAGQNLTKIETLRLTIRYISHLSDLLGLSKETLTQRKEAEVRKCDTCPEGLGCCQEKLHRLCPKAALRLEKSFQDSELCQSSPCCPYMFTKIRDFPLGPGEQALGAESESRSLHCSEVRLPPVQQGTEVILPASCSLQKHTADQRTSQLTPEESPLSSPVSIDLGFFQVQQ